MKTYEPLDEDARLFAFEVNNAGLGRKGVCRAVKTIPGAQVIRRPNSLSWFRESRILVGAFMVAVGIVMFGGAEGAGETLQALTGIALGAYFVNFALTGQRSFWSHRHRK